MAMRYAYFDSEIIGVDEDGMPIFDRAENSEMFALILAKLVSNGVLAQPGDCFQVKAPGSGLNIEVQPGFGLINGRCAYDSAVSTFTLEKAPANYGRIDRVVLRCNYLERLCEIVVKTGTPAATPSAPELVQPASGDYYELGLATIAVAANQSILTQSAITDTRPDSSVCGYVTQLIDHIDTSVLFAQFNAFYTEFVAKSNADMEEFQNASEASFNEWFSGVKAALDGDTAGNLLNLIQANAAEIAELHEMDDALIEVAAAQQQQIDTQIVPVTCTLPVSSWAAQEDGTYTQTVAVSGVTADNVIIPGPDPASYTAYNEAGVRCTAQAENALTFLGEGVPETALLVNIVILNAGGVSDDS